MATWITILITDLLIPVIMIVFGRVFLHAAPKEINFLYGYRTARSMKNRETWAFAHRHIGRIWGILGWILLLLTALGMTLLWGRDEALIGTVGTVYCVLQLIALILSLVPTELALKKHFHEDGTPRESK